MIVFNSLKRKKATLKFCQIVRAVVSHERAMKAQAKKMNVDSLKSGADQGAESAEMKIAKVAFFCKIDLGSDNTKNSIQIVGF